MSEKKNTFKSILLKYILYYIVIIGVAFNVVVYKAEVGKLEKLWSDTMLFINFGVLVFLYIKYAHRPLTNFLKGEGNKISEQLQRIEADVKEARSGMESESIKLKEIDANLEDITKSIIAAGKREKESVINRAQAVADKMVSDAKKETEYKMLAAKKRFSEEMLEAAIKITAENIKMNITKEDDDNLIAGFTSDLDSEQKLFV